MESATSPARLLETLQRFLEMPSGELQTALQHTCDVVASELGADKVDAFLYEPARETLFALGTSNQPLSALQRKVGLDTLAIANGGRVAHVFLTGKTFVTGRLDADSEELRGITETLKIKSKLGVPIVIAGHKRGVLMVASQKPDYFTPEHVRWVESIARWIGIVAHRAELVEQIARNAAEQGRRAAAEELVTVLAHDLRNMLAPIVARVEILRRRCARRSDEDARDVDAALKGLARLGRVISDMLDVARIDQGLFAISLQPLDLVALVREEARTLSTPDHPIHVQAPEEIVVAADPERIRQCLQNLLSNAVTHSPDQSPVEVLIEQKKVERGALAQVQVIDQGPGIPPEVLPGIFERFTKGKSSAGLGLGLFLARQIAAAHGGELTVDSRPGHGTRFRLLIPCERKEG
ncbi:MAG TPA: GAF domain-containing sensor histidine kinase [Myxococcales bacterium]|nr:GAF domain-containing sensor histidine kinase [Myxococcales bacterium]